MGSTSKPGHAAKSKLAAIFTAATIASALLSAPAAANAAIVYGSATVINGWGVTYKGQHDLQSNWPRLSSWSHIWTAGGGNVPAGWMGVKVMGYNAQYGLTFGSGGVYNPGRGSATGVLGYKDYPAKGTYYAQGEAYTWNGNGYNTWWPGRTPYLAW